MNERDRTLDDAIAKLPRALPPARDLWPAIEARLTREGGTLHDTGGRAEALADRVPAGGASDRKARGDAATWGGWRAIAATGALMAATALLTFTATRQAYAPAGSARAQSPGAEFTTVSDRVLPVEYRMARGELMAVLEASLARLDPRSRRLVAANLAEIRAALAEIDDALAQDPDNAALQQLYVSTSQQELSLMRSVRRLAASTEDQRS